MRFLSLLFLFTFVGAIASGSPLCSKVMVSESKALVRAQNHSLESASVVKLTQESPTFKMIDAQIIHSDFLKEVLGQLKDRSQENGLNFKFGDAKSIALLDRRQTTILAQKIYEEMKVQLLPQKGGQSNSKSSVDHLDDPVATRRVFLEFSKVEIVDKIEESLIVIGKEGKFTDHKNEITEIKNTGLDDLPGGEARVGSIGVGIVASIASGIIAVLPEWNGSVIFTGGEITALSISSAMFLGPIIESRFTRNFLRNRLNRKRLRSHQDIEANDYLDLASLSYTPGQTRENILRIQEEFRKINEVDPSTSNLRTFGSQSVQLHKELNLAFHTDFMRWMSMYEQNRTEIRKRMIEIREGNTRSSESKQEVVNFLAKMLGEASEATQLSGQLSENIIRVIERDLNLLKEMDTSNLSSFEMRDHERRVSFLRLALATHRQFLMSLEPIHITITDLLYSLETLGLAESAALTLEMGQRTQRLDQVEQVKEIIEGLNRMDSFLNDLNANARVIEDAEIID